jgi:methylated-DNA-[protein]-cysteine S-methyltransferase
MLIETCFSTPFGNLNVVHDEHFLFQADFSDDRQSRSYSLQIQKTIAEQLDKYTHDPRFRFDLPFKLQGTVFQRKVWNALCVIPSGQTKTYGQLAHTLETSPRAIGQACKTNPLPLFIPCHRIISHAGIGGYKGRVDDVIHKEHLLAHEGVKLD